MHHHQYQGIIINRVDVKDGDRFLTIFTQEVGKLSVYARSVRSVKSKRLASLNLYNEIRFQVVSHGHRRTLTQVELLNSYRLGKHKLTDISRLFVIGELINSFLPEEEANPSVYELLSTALTHLADFETPTYLLRFKQKLLKLLGYGQVSEAELDSYIESLLDHSVKVDLFGTIKVS